MNVASGDFLVPVDKPEGPTSHDVVDAARRALHTRRIGHTGTLDPFASGLLMLCIGRATRLAEYLTGMDKSYEAVARLGVSTDTLDREGEVVANSGAWSDLARGQVEEALAAFRGTIEQVPPQFSAKKVEGEAMHRRARRGETVVLDACRVTIHEIEILSFDLPEVRFFVRCSSGTYVRCLARDLGDALGVGAHLTGLRRTAIGSFMLDDAIGLDDLGSAEAVGAAAIEPLDALAHLPTLSVDDDVAQRLAHGQRVPMPIETEGVCAVAHDGGLLAIGEMTDGVLGPRKVFGR